MNGENKNRTVTMAHGAGGRQTSELIENIFASHFANPDLTEDDAAVLMPPAGKMAVSTDGFIVSPAFFPGGNIGMILAASLGGLTSLTAMFAGFIPPQSIRAEGMFHSVLYVAFLCGGIAFFIVFALLLCGWQMMKMKKR